MVTVMRIMQLPPRSEDLVLGVVVVLVLAPARHEAIRTRFREASARRSIVANRGVDPIERRAFLIDRTGVNSSPLPTAWSKAMSVAPDGCGY